MLRRVEGRLNRSSLRYALTNVSYTGDYLSNKHVKIIDRNGKTKTVKNNGHVGQMLLEGHHEAIVSRELFDAVQKLVDRVLLALRKTAVTEEEEALMETAMIVAAAEASVHRHYGTESFKVSDSSGSLRSPSVQIKQASLQFSKPAELQDLQSSEPSADLETAAFQSAETLQSAEPEQLQPEQTKLEQTASEPEQTASEPEQIASEDWETADDTASEDWEAWTCQM